MQVAVKKWGNSASVRIPAAILEATRLQVDDMVEIREEEGRIVIEPLHPQAYDLDRMLAAITADNQHGEVDFGPAVGKEAF
jgi:antitoxin MazE